MNFQDAIKFLDKHTSQDPTSPFGPYVTRSSSIRSRSYIIIRPFDRKILDGRIYYEKGSISWTHCLINFSVNQIMSDWEILKKSDVEAYWAAYNVITL